MLKVRNRVLVRTFSVSFFIVTLWTSTTPCSCSSVLTSTSVMPDSSRQRMTPRDEFNALWMETRTGLSTNRVILRRPIACDFLAHSTRKDPSLNLLMLLRVPATAWNPFWTAKGDNLLSGRSSRDLGVMATLSVRQKMPFFSCIYNHQITVSPTSSFSASFNGNPRRREAGSTGAHILVLVYIPQALSTRPCLNLM